MAEEKVMASFEMPKQMYEQVFRLAKSDERPMSYHIRKAIQAYLEKQQPPAAAQKAKAGK